uniref:Uncharacterized protein n=1 Tax=Siphoviridae sp. ctM5A27 TaxID=2825459 RepID=A0A8S5PF91_9CAUD|nr:MAG TPA: hypothetical protein [Siphoviridae sp. ctM5A27]
MYKGSEKLITIYLYYIFYIKITLIYISIY